MIKTQPRKINEDREGISCYVVQNGEANPVVMGTEEGNGRFGTEWIYVNARDEQHALAIAAAYDINQHLTLTDDERQSAVAEVE